MLLFAIATLAPLPLLALGVLWGGGWTLAGLGYMTVLPLLLDQWPARPDVPEGTEFPAADALLVILALVHLAGLPLAVWLLAGPSALGLAERAALLGGIGLVLGQISVPAAHELIHRGDRRLFSLGRAIYVTLLFGHHASAHRLVHHRHAASPADPNTARRGEGYYRFALRAWAGSFRAGWQAENALQRGGVHPYAIYMLGAAASLALAFGLGGMAGLLVWAGLAAHAQSQLLLADYVQHYGLARRLRSDGRPEPVTDAHSWNAPQWFSSAVMLNAPRHSDHHAHPSRPYPALRLPAAEAAPRLPYALPVTCVLALVPPLWRRVMHPRLAAWQATQA